MRELREETGFEGLVTHVSPLVYNGGCGCGCA